MSNIDPLQTWPVSPLPGIELKLAAGNRLFRPDPSCASVLDSLRKLEREEEAVSPLGGRAATLSSLVTTGIDLQAEQ